MLKYLFMMIISIIVGSGTANAEFYRDIDPENERHVDVLVTYTPETIEKDFGGSLQIFKDYIDYEMTALNMIYSLSGLSNGYFRLVGIAEYDDNVSQQCNEYGADIRVAIVYSTGSVAVANTLTTYDDFSGCACASISGNNIVRPPNFRSYIWIFQHEVTHLMGGLHEKLTTDPDFPRIAPDVLAYSGMFNYRSRTDIMAVSTTGAIFPFVSNVNNTYGGITWGVEGESNLMRELEEKAFQFVTERNPQTIPNNLKATESDIIPDALFDENHSARSLPKRDSKGNRLTYFPDLKDATKRGFIDHPMDGITLQNICWSGRWADLPRSYEFRAFNGFRWSKPFKVSHPIQPCGGQPWPDDPPPPPPPPPSNTPDLNGVYMLLLNNE